MQKLAWRTQNSCVVAVHAASGFMVRGIFYCPFNLTVVDRFNAA